MKRLGLLLGLALGGGAWAAPDLEALMTTPFNAAHYALGYEVFLNNGNTAAAYRVAERAVKHLPSDMEWHRRLATVARWQNRADVALDHWLAVARATDADDAWDAVRDLAAQLFDHEARLAVQQREARRHPDDGNRLDDIVLAYEQLGRPDEGLAYLAALAAERPTRALLDAQAKLAERNGEPDRALAALRELIRRYSPPDEDWLARAATLHYARGELDAAWALLASAAPKMPRTASRFWQVYGHLSHVLGKEQPALAAYGHLHATGQATDEDLQRYTGLLQKENPGSAASVQARLYRRSPHPEAAALAIYLWARARDAKAAEAFLNSLEVEQFEALEADPAFREARGDLRLVQGRWQDALADYEAALKLAPGEARVQQAWLSLMTSHGEPAGLRRLLLEGAPAVDDNPKLASAWAAGWLRLDEPAQALPWLRIAFEQNPADLLRGLAYADGLARAGYPDDAALLRRDLWSRREKALTAATTTDRAALEQALLDVELAQLPVDARHARLRALLAEAYRDRDPTRHRHWNWLREQLLAGAADGDSPQRLAYLQQRLPGGSGHWPAVTLALAGGTAEELAQLLADRSADLPAARRVEVAQRLGQPALATRLAFAGAERQPNSAELQQQLQALAWDDGRAIDTALQHDRQGALLRRSASVDVRGQQHDPWRLYARVESAQLESRDEAQLRLPDDAQTQAALGLTWTTRRWRAQAGLTLLEGLDSAVGAVAGAQHAYCNGVVTGVHLGTLQPATASAGLIAGGMQDEARVWFGWQIGDDDYLELSGDHQRFQAQDGSALGELAAGSFGYRRLLTPGVGGWSVEAGVTVADTRTEKALPVVLLPLLPVGETPDPVFFVPPDYTQYRVALVFGEQAGQGYSAYWQPFGAVGATDDEESGSGYDFRLGAVGPVLGEDRLRVFVEGARGAQSKQERRVLVNLMYSVRY